MDVPRSVKALSSLTIDQSELRWSVRRGLSPCPQARAHLYLGFDWCPRHHSIVLVLCLPTTSSPDRSGSFHGTLLLRPHSRTSLLYS